MKEIEDENLVGLVYTDENIFLEDVSSDDFENWTSDDFINNIPKSIETSYLKIFWQSNQWYAYYNDKIIEKGNFLDETLYKLFLKVNENKC